jgi:predicted transcriptional regulator
VWEDAVAITTSIRLPDDVRDQYETLAQATGRSRNELMVHALREVADRQLREIAMIQEGIRAAEEGRVTPIEEVIADYIARGMLTRADFEDDAEQAPV